MNKLLSTAIAATLLAAPAFAFAQSSNGPTTREQVRAELVAARQAGQLDTNDINYPQVVASGAADAQVAARADTSSSAGASTSGSSAAGGSAVNSGPFSVYRGQ